MDNERIREICMALPHVAETVSWGHHLVFWAGDRDVGGKMFALTHLDGNGFGVLWFHCGAERFHELLEIEGISASPYLARAHWVTVERWDVLRTREFEDELKRAYTLVFERLPKRTRTILAMPEKERARLVRERKSLLAQRAAAESASNEPSRRTSKPAKSARKPAVPREIAVKTASRSKPSGRAQD
jgi:predicted DNA-binding protein (MmcQ/YjbR family)